MSQYQKYQTLYVIKDIPDSAVHSKGDDKTMFALKGAECQFIIERQSTSGWLDVWFKGNPIYCLPAEYFSATPPEAEEPSMDIWSRYYSGSGETLDYVYELEGDTLMIWFGGRGSPAYYQGTLSTDGNTLTGAWHYPGGGGYQANASRIA